MVALTLAAQASNEEADSWMGKFGATASEYAKYSVPSTLVSAGVSFFNTGVSLGNAFGADWEEASTEQILDSFSSNGGGYWGNAADFYADNQSIIDTASLIGGSLVPGTIAVRALRGIQQGRRISKAGGIAGNKFDVTKPWYRTNNIPSVELGKLTEKIHTTGRSSKLIGQEQAKLLAGGMKQQAMESAVYETATLLTMNQNSIFGSDDLGYFESVNENLRHVVYGTVLGGAVGGGLQYLSEFGDIKKMLRQNAQGITNKVSATQDVGLRNKDGILDSAVVPGDTMARNYRSLFGRRGIVDAIRGGDRAKAAKQHLFGNPDLNIEEFTELKQAADTTLETSLFRFGNDVKSAAKKIDPDEANNIQKQFLQAFFPNTNSAGLDDYKFPQGINQLDFQKIDRINSEQMAKILPGLDGVGHFDVPNVQQIDALNNLDLEDLRVSYDMADLIPKGAERAATLTPELQDSISAIARGKLDKSIKTGNVSDVGSLKFLFATKQDGMLQDIIPKKKKLSPRSAMLIEEMQENLVDQFPHLKKFNDLRKDYEKFDASYIKNKWKLDDATFGEMLDIVEKNFYSPAKLREGVQLFDRKSKTTRVPQGPSKSARGNLHNLVKDTVFAKGSLYNTAAVDMKTGKVVDNFVPSIMDVPASQRSRMMKTKEDTAFNISVDHFNQQRNYEKMGGEKLVKELKETKIFKEADIPKLDAMYRRISSLAKSMDKDQKGSVHEFLRNELPEIRVQLDGYPQMKKKFSSIEDLNQFREYVKTVQVAKLERAGKLSAEEIAIRANVDPRFLEMIHTNKRIYDLEDRTGYFVDAADNSTRHFKLQYTKEAELDDAAMQGQVQALKRLRVQQEYNSRVVADVIGEDFDAQLIQEIRKSGKNFAAGASKIDSGPGFFTAQQGELGTIKQFTVPIGKTLSYIQGKVKEKILEQMNPAAQRVIDDPGALAELAVLDQKFRQGRYAARSSMHPDLQAVIPDNIHYIKDGATRLDDEYKKMLANGDQEGAQALIVQLHSNFRGMGARPHSPLDEMDFITVSNPATREFLNTMQRMNNEQVIDKIKKLDYATGNVNNWDQRVMYPGKYDTKRFNHFYIISDPAEKLGNRGVKNTGFITAPNKDLLQKKLAALQAERTKKNLPPLIARSSNSVEEFKKFVDEYESNFALTDELVDSSLASEKKLFDYMPEPNKEVVNSMINSVLGNSDAVARKAIKLKYANEIDLLKQYGKTDADSILGKSQGKLSAFDQQINTMLNISNSKDHKWWNDLNETFDDAVSTAYFKLKSMSNAAFKFGNGGNKKELEAWTELNSMLKSHGFPTPFDDLENRILATTNAPYNVVKGFVAKSNGLFATTLLRWDTAQAIVNSMSTPILLMPELKALRTHLNDEKAWSMVHNKLASKLQTAGGEINMTSNMKLMQQAMSDIFKPGVLESYRKRGLLNSLLQDIRDAVGDLGYQGETSIGKIQARLSKVSNVLSAVTDKSEELVKFVAGRSAELMLDDVAKIAGANIDAVTRDSIIKSVINKVHGNYTASQRPILFQGSIGQAVGLFQTYTFNLMQRAATHWQNGEKGNVRTMLGLQSTIFGAQSVPGFQLLNDYVARETDGEKDFYSETLSKLGPVGEFLLYGAGSTATAPIFGQGIDFFNRGDLTPRTPIIIPTRPSEVPMINFLSTIAGNFKNTVSQLGAGADISETLGQALAHNGLNRPLQGLAQTLWTGNRTSNQGNIIADYPSWTDPDFLSMHNFFNIATKALGTQTLDEAIGVAAQYRAIENRVNRYKSTAKLGAAVKSDIRAGDGKLTRDQVNKALGKFVETGGSADNFNTWMGNNYVNATDTQLKQMVAGTTNESKYLWSIMESNPGTFLD